MDFLTSIKEKARKSKKTIVLPESFEKRNLEAAATTLKEGFADIVLIGNKDEIMKAAQEAGGFDVSSASAKFDRMEEKVVQKEAQAQAFTDIAADNNYSDEKEFEKIENASKVDSELERLKAEMGL